MSLCRVEKDIDISAAPPLADGPMQAQEDIEKSFTMKVGGFLGMGKTESLVKAVLKNDTL